jgi:hypothetical protein
MEFLCFVYGTVTIALLVAHVDDYMKAWPRGPFTVHPSGTSIQGRAGIANPSPEFP